jgi:hypothetical protein
VAIYPRSVFVHSHCDKEVFEGIEYAGLQLIQCCCTAMKLHIDSRTDSCTLHLREHKDIQAHFQEGHEETTANHVVYKNPLI